MNKPLSEQYDVKDKNYILEEAELSTELSDEADNELYIRYKQMNMEEPGLL